MAGSSIKSISQGLYFLGFFRISRFLSLFLKIADCCWVAEKIIRRQKVFKSKRKKLKAKNISITESLTRYRMSVLNEAREKYGFKNVWTYDGRILYKDNNDGQKIKIYYD